jgi:hypothetical protein
MAADNREWWQKGEAPPVPNAEQSGLIVNGVAQMLAVIGEAMSAVFDSAEGIKAEMSRRGYSETAIEHAAMTHISLAQQMLWTGGGQR